MNNEKLWLAGKPIKTSEEYEEVLGMVEKLERFIADRWLDEDPQIKGWVHAHEKLASSLLAYDIEEDKLPF
jgi:hypothetical protein